MQQSVTMISNKGSQSSLQKVPQLSEPLEDDKIFIWETTQFRIMDLIS